MVHWLTHLLEQFGPILVFVLIFLESMGLPFPGETVLLTGAAFAAAGKLSIAWVAIAAVSGGFGGAAAGYALGRGAVGAWLRRRPHDGATHPGGATGHLRVGLAGGTFVLAERVPCTLDLHLQTESVLVRQTPGG